ncbi:MAG: hypothetical protein ILP07_09110 [Treponema sp.]|nr:hypothetical protein [Treponema sp.]
MKKIHIYLANCKESAYSGEDVIVSRKRLIGFLDELNQAVFEVCEQYEATKEAKDRALMNAEHEAAEIKDDAMNRAENIYAASLIYTEDAINSIKNSLEATYIKLRKEYGALIKNYDEKMKELDSNAEELKLSMHEMADTQLYLRLIEQMKERNKSSAQREEEERKEEIKSKVIGTVTSVETLAPEEGSEEQASAAPVQDSEIKVYDAPKLAEVSTKGKKKKEGFLKKILTLAAGKNEEIEVKEEAIDKNY